MTTIQLIGLGLAQLVPITSIHYSYQKLTSEPTILPHRMLSLMDLLLLFLYWLMVAALVLHVLHMTALLLESYRQSPRYINTYMATHIELRHTQSGVMNYT